MLKKLWKALKQDSVKERLARGEAVPMPYGIRFPISSDMGQEPHDPFEEENEQRSSQ